jgi:hypothetical protein
MQARHWQRCGAGAGVASSRNFWPEPELKPVYKVSAPAPGSGSRSEESSTLNQISYQIRSCKGIKSIFFTKNKEKSTF